MSAPSEANLRAIAFPIPLAAPVMRATYPSRSPISKVLDVSAKLPISSVTPKFLAQELAKKGSLWPKTIFCGQKRVSLPRF
jgi:hypothetical protein